MFCLQVGQLIASKKGVVTAEELGPYLDVTAANVRGEHNDGEVLDEGFVVPALIRFGGSADVDDNGNIVYTFPSFQKTAQRRVGIVSTLCMPMLDNLLCCPFLLCFLARSLHCCNTLHGACDKLAGQAACKPALSLLLYVQHLLEGPMSSLCYGLAC